MKPTKKVPEKFEGRGDQRGFSFEMVHRSPTHAVYSKRKDGQTTYEVAKVRRRKKDVCIAGREIAKEGDEYLPSSSEWGVAGWSYNTEEEAINKMERAR